MEFDVQLTTHATKDLEKISAAIREKLLIRLLEELKKYPQVTDVKKLQTADILYRKRIGDWRINFEVDGKKHNIFIHSIKNRKDAYKNL